MAVQQELETVTAQVAELQGRIDEFDRNPSKKIRAPDLNEALRGLGHRCTRKEIEDMIWEVDENMDGYDSDCRRGAGEGLPVALMACGSIAPGGDGCGELQNKQSCGANAVLMRSSPQIIYGGIGSGVECVHLSSLHLRAKGIL